MPAHSGVTRKTDFNGSNKSNTQALEWSIMAGMKEVARHAGVSVSTVSNVINGRHQKMAVETLNRANVAIREL